MIGDVTDRDFDRVVEQAGCRCWSNSGSRAAVTASHSLSQLEQLQQEIGQAADDRENERPGKLSDSR